MIVRLNKTALQESATSKPIGVEGDKGHTAGKISEVEKIVADAKRKVEEGGAPGLGVSGSNSGKGHDPTMPTSSSSPSGGPAAPTKETSPKRDTKDAPSKDTSNAKELFKGFNLGNTSNSSSNMTSSMERVVEEEPTLVTGDAPEVDTEVLDAGVGYDRRAAVAGDTSEESEKDGGDA